MACVVVICAETDAEAERIASSGRMMFSLLRQGRLIPIPPVEKALAYFAGRGGSTGRRGVVGSRRGCAKASSGWRPSTAPTS